MISQKVELTMNGKTYNLTPRVDPLSIVINENIDQTLGTASFKMGAMPPNLGGGEGIDFSRPLIRYSKVIITIQDEVFEYLLAEDHIRMQSKELPNRPALYEHSITLIEPIRLTQGTLIRDLSITQPKGNIGVVTYSGFGLTDNTVNLEPFNNVPVDFKKKGVVVANNYVEIGLKETAESNLPDILDGLILKKKDIVYQINPIFIIYNTQVFQMPFATGTSPFTELTIEILSNGNVIHSRTDGILGGKGSYINTVVTPENVRVSLSYNYQPQNENEVISIRMKTTGSYSIINGEIVNKFEDKVNIVDASLIIRPKITYELPTISLAEVMDRVLITEIGKQKFKLGENTRSRINQTVSPEFTFQKYTMYQALKEIAGVVGAIPKMNLDYEVEFDFFDDLETSPTVEAPNVQYMNGVGQLDNYVNKIELNADNVVNEETIKRYPGSNGYATLRTSAVGMITTDNIEIILPDSVVSIHKVVIKGISIEYKDIPGHGVNYDWDISERVLQNKHYDTLEEGADYAQGGRTTKNKNNCLYYIPGENKIQGLAFKGKKPKGMIDNFKPNRAIYETVFATAMDGIDTNENVMTVDSGKVESDNKIMFYIEYTPYVGTRAEVYRDDQTGFQDESSKFFNETARINDPKTLGDIAKNTINRLGNTIYHIGGTSKELYLIPKKGSRNNKGQITTNRSISILGTVIRYDLSLVKDYAVLSDYVGIKSVHRQYEIQKDNLVTTIDKYKEFIFLGKTTIESESSIYGDTFLKNMIKGIFSVGNNVLSYALLEVMFEGDSNYKKERYLLTVNIETYGSLISFNIKTKDNYSVGLKKYTEVDNGITTTWQEEVRYTDVYGRIKKVRMALFDSNFNMTQQQADDYPITKLTSSGASRLEYTVNKDARQILALSQEVTFLSNEDDVRIHNGITRYNFTNDRKKGARKEYILFKDGYFPSKNTTIVDLTKVEAIYGRETVVNNEIFVTLSVPNGEYIGWGMVETNTSELVICVKDAIVNTGAQKMIDKKLYWGIKKSPIGL